MGLRFFTLYTEKVPLRWSVGRSVGWSLRKVLVAERCVVSNTLENRKKDAICYCFCCSVGNGWAYEHTHTYTKHPKDTLWCIFLQASPVSQFGIGKQTPIVRIPFSHKRVGKPTPLVVVRIGIGLVSGTIACVCLFMFMFNDAFVHQGLTKRKKEKIMLIIHTTHQHGRPLSVEFYRHCSKQTLARRRDPSWECAISRSCP